MTTTKTEIVQIVEATPGWRAAFKSEDGSLYHYQVLCWALVEQVEDGERFRFVDGMIGGETIDLCGSMSNFNAFFGPGEEAAP